MSIGLISPVYLPSRFWTFGEVRSELSRTRRSTTMDGVGIIATWFAAGVWIYTKAARRDLQGGMLRRGNR